MGNRRERQTHFRSANVVLTERDELAYSRVLKERFPDVLFFDGMSASAYHENIETFAHGTTPWLSAGFPAPGQEERWALNTEMRCLMVQPLVRLDVHRSRWEWLNPDRKWAFDLPLFGWGKVTVGFPKDDAELKRFAGHILRLVNKVTYRQALGLDACLWSQAGVDERRGLGIGQVIDPSEPIKLNKYYDDSLWSDRLPDEPTWSRNRELPDDFRRVAD